MLRVGRIDLRETSADTRSSHRLLFEPLAPPEYPGFAGNYRGCNLPYLKEYNVRAGQIRGCEARLVADHMDGFAVVVRSVADFIRGVMENDSASRAEKVAAVSQAVATVFALFLQIHPYADGNGHIARYIVVALMGLGGLAMQRWTIDPRPALEEYMACLLRADVGDFDPLARMLLDCLVPEPVS